MQWKYNSLLDERRWTLFKYGKKKKKQDREDDDDNAAAAAAAAAADDDDDDDDCIDAQYIICYIAVSTLMTT